MHIERSYVSPRNIISLGCDCHPAYALQQMNLRRASFPFDWLNTIPHLGLQYVSENIDTGFSKFQEGLMVNSRGHLVSSHYDYAELIHEKGLAENKEDREKFRRRFRRFLQTLEKEDIRFLYNFPVSEITESGITIFTNSVKRFTEKLKENDTLHIYLRYDEGYSENKQLADKLFASLTGGEKVYVSRYIRQLGRYGIWGNPAMYPELLKKLNIPVKEVFPRIYIK